MSSKVSIIIPVYNRERFIEEVVKCAINQTYTNIELVIVDNKSTDNTWEILKNIALSDTRIKIHQNNVNLGPTLNWQKCIELVTGEYIKILWSDDYIENNYIEKAMLLFNSEVAFVISGYNIFESDTKQILYQSKFNYKNYLVEDYLTQLVLYKTTDFPVSPGSAIFRTRDVEESLLIDIPNNDSLDFKRYGAGNDLLIMLLIANKYKDKFIICIKENLSCFRSHSSSISVSNELSLYYEYARFYFAKNFMYEVNYNSYKARIYVLYKLNKNYKNIYADIVEIGVMNIINYLLHLFYYKIKFKLSTFNK